MIFERGVALGEGWKRGRSLGEGMDGGRSLGERMDGVPGDEDRVQLRVSVLLSLREKDGSHGWIVLRVCVEHSHYGK